MIQRSVFFLSSQNLEVIRWVTYLMSPSKNMQFCNEQIRTQPLFSPPCASATYGSARMCRRKTGLASRSVWRPPPSYAATITTRVYYCKWTISTFFPKNWEKWVIPGFFYTGRPAVYNSQGKSPGNSSLGKVKGSWGVLNWGQGKIKFGERSAKSQEIFLLGTSYEHNEVAGACRLTS